MITYYRCGHDGEQHHTAGAFHWRACGCDGTLHYACHPWPAPHGTPRPDNWPAFRVWRTEPGEDQREVDERGELHRTRFAPWRRDT